MSIDDDEPIWKDGAPTEYGIEVFTAGDCWVLAYYLHKIGGWPIFSIAPRADLRWWEHIVVQIDADTYLDVMGPQEASKMLETWAAGDSYVYVLEGARFRSWKEYELFMGGDLCEFYYQNSRSKARRMAQLLFDKYELKDRVLNG